MPRTARYHVAGDPSVAAELWVVLHGYGQLAGRFLKRFDALAGLAEGWRAVVAPEALSRYYVGGDGGGHGPDSRVGASWMTREDRQHEIDDYVGYLDAVVAACLEDRRPAEPPPRLVALGFSQGSETVSRWAAYGAWRVDELILWGGGLAADLDMVRAGGAMGEADICFVVGDDDSWARSRSAESVEHLGRHGLAARVVRYDGGHRIAGQVLESGWPGPPRPPGA